MGLSFILTESVYRTKTLGCAQDGGKVIDWGCWRKKFSWKDDKRLIKYKQRKQSSESTNGYEIRQNSKQR